MCLLGSVQGIFGKGSLGEDEHQALDKHPSPCLEFFSSGFAWTRIDRRKVERERDVVMSVRRGVQVD